MHSTLILVVVSLLTFLFGVFVGWALFGFSTPEDRGDYYT